MKDYLKFVADILFTFLFIPVIILFMVWITFGPVLLANEFRNNLYLLLYILNFFLVTSIMYHESRK